MTSGAEIDASGAGNRRVADAASAVLLAGAPCQCAYNVTHMANGLTYKRVTSSTDATKQLAATLAPYLRPGHVLVLTGDLGAGKTQFAQGLAAALGVGEPVVSPTFNIVLSYEGRSLPFHHFDLYRLEDAEELEDIGFYEYLEGEGVTLIEWGDKFPGKLPISYLEIEIRSNEEGKRTVIAHSVGELHRRLLCLWANDSKARLLKAPR